MRLKFYQYNKNLLFGFENFCGLIFAVFVGLFFLEIRFFLNFSKLHCSVYDENTHSQKRVSSLNFYATIAFKFKLDKDI